MSESQLIYGRIGLILMIIAQSLYIPLMFIDPYIVLGPVLGLAVNAILAIFSIVSTLLASFIFQYFNEIYGSTLAKVTFIMTLIAIFGLLFDLLVVLAGLFFLPLIFVGAILLLLTIPALLVYYLLWGITFVQISGDSGNPSLMMAGGIVFLVGWVIGLGGLIAIVGAVAQAVSIIGIVLVTIVLFTDETGA